jgi:hypothetical protein
MSFKFINEEKYFYSEDDSEEVLDNDTFPNNINNSDSDDEVEELYFDDRY